MIKNKVKTLLFDIETSPNLGYYFELYREGNILWNKENWHLLSFSWKWLGESKTNVLALPDFKIYKKDPNNDIELVKELWKLFDKADIIIAHNGQAFDIKKSTARFIYHKLQPPAPYKQVDTKLVAKRYFKFDSNKLDDLGDYLNIGRKLETEKGLWKKCLEGDKKAWFLMKKYNKQDVVLLEKVYLAMLPFINNHPNMGILLGERSICPNCGSKHLQSRGTYYDKRNWFCVDCRSWHTSSLKDNSQVK